MRLFALIAFLFSGPAHSATVLPAGFEFYNPVIPYVETTSSDGQYRGLLDPYTRLWAYGKGTFLPTPAPAPVKTATTTVKAEPGGYIASDGLSWGPMIRKDSHTSSKLFPMAFLKGATDNARVDMTYEQAKTCCNTGTRVAGYPDACPFGAHGSHLPTKEEFQTLSAELGYQTYNPYGYATLSGYDPTQVPDLTAGVFFWSSTDYTNPDPGDGCRTFNDDRAYELHPEQYAWYFYVPHGCMDKGARYVFSAVRCVSRP